MRIRILRTSVGVLDGVSLAHLFPGLTYDVPDSLGAHLVTTGAAEAASPTSTTPNTLKPVDFVDVIDKVQRGVIIAPPGEAADKLQSRRSRGKKHKTSTER